MTKILVTPRSLSRADHPALAALVAAGFDIVIPTPGVLPDAETLKKALPGCVGWLAGVEKITDDILVAGTDLRIIARNGVGVDNVDLAAAEARNIRVANTPGANARGVAELALALVFAIARNIPAMDASIKSGGWARRQGLELHGKTLGVVGTGQIGKTLVQMGLALGMTALGCDLFPDGDFRPDGFRYADIHDIAAQSDIVSVHIPGGDKPAVDAEFIGKMRKGAILVNTARASAVDADAVLRALDEDRLLGYGVDAFDAEPPGVTALTGHPKVICTSHVGGFTAESVSRSVERAVAAILHELNGS